MQAVFGINPFAAAEVELFEIFWNFGQIGNGRCLTTLQCLDHDHILNGRTQGVTGKSLGVGNADVFQVIAEGTF